MVAKDGIIGSKKLIRIFFCSIVILILGSSIITFLIVRGNSKEEQEVPLEALIEVDKIYAYVDEDIEFYGNASTGDIKSYVWDFGYEITEEGSNITMSFDKSRYYNVYLTVTDVNGEQDITMANISIFNKDVQGETSGSFLYGDNRRGPSYDWYYLEILPGINNPTIYANVTGSTLSAYVEVYLWTGSEYIYEQPILLNEDLEVRFVLEDIFIDRDNWCEVGLRCERGYITNYKLELSIDYPSE